MTTLGLVAVRLKSSRLPKKALKLLAGKPLIVRLMERLQNSRQLDELILCTSTDAGDDEIEAIAAAHQFSLFRGDPLDVMSRFLQVAKNKNAHTVVRITGDNPLTDPDLLDYLVTQHLAHQAEYSFTDQPPRGTRCEIIDVAALHRIYDQLEDPASSEYMTYMLKRPDHVKTQRVEIPDQRLHRPNMRLTVDTPEDFALMEAIFNAFDGHPPPLAELIAWLEKHPDILQLNAHIQPVEDSSLFNVRYKSDELGSLSDSQAKRIIL